MVYNPRELGPGLSPAANMASPYGSSSLFISFMIRLPMSCSCYKTQLTLLLLGATNFSDFF